MPHATLIANPASGRGRGARLIPGARAAFAAAGITDVRITSHAGDEARLVRAALDDGATSIAVLGGDGTWGKCAAALADSGADARIAFLRGGTGNDFAKNLGAPAHDFGRMAALVAGGGNDARVDMGRVESGGHADWFLNVAGFGFDVAVLEDTMRGGALSGPAVYVGAAMRELLRYPGFRVTIDALGQEERPSMMLVVSNGLNFGGAFRIAPTARVNDGQLDLVEVGDIRGLARIPLFVRVMRGVHLRHGGVTAARAPAFRLSFAEPPAYEIDGELRRAATRDVRVACAPGVLRVVGAVATGAPSRASAGSAGTAVSGAASVSTDR